MGKMRKVVSVILGITLSLSIFAMAAYQMVCAQSVNVGKYEYSISDDVVDLYVGQTRYVYLLVKYPPEDPRFTETPVPAVPIAAPKSDVKADETPSATSMPVETANDENILKGSKYISGDTAIATADDFGNVTGVAPGETTIKIMLTDINDKNYELSFKVFVHQTGVELNYNDAAYVYVGKTYKPEIIGDENNIKGWKSKNKKIATVNKNGLIKGIKSGKTIITYVNEGKTYSFKLNVRNITIDRAIATVGCRSAVNVTGFSRKNAKWSVKSKKIATISKKGILKGLKVGTTKVIAKVGKRKVSAKVRIVKNCKILDSEYSNASNPQKTIIFIAKEACIKNNKLTVTGSIENKSDQSVDTIKRLALSADIYGKEVAVKIYDNYKISLQPNEQKEITLTLAKGKEISKVDLCQKSIVCSEDEDICNSGNSGSWKDGMVTVYGYIEN